MSKASIEQRYTDSGFVYTSRTRMLFAPRYVATRQETDADSRDIVIMAANGWEQPNKKDIAEIQEALIEAYPERNLLIDTTEGLVPIATPTK